MPTVTCFLGDDYDPTCGPERHLHCKAGGHFPDPQRTHVLPFRTVER